ncbi:MAG: hypothetical protein C0432_01350 [Candidatus Puniceispirillum sp.]|nr:hypothetical protein [Candidatus Pelagibacter sp.]MBA4282927.1 hypothetical protein [Candidatus Puniceispirillum sp.]
MTINISTYIFTLIVASSSLVSLKAEERIESTQQQSSTRVPLYIKYKDGAVNPEDSFVKIELTRKDSFESVEEILSAEQPQKKTFISGFFQKTSEIVKSTTIYIYNFIASFFR